MKELKKQFDSIKQQDNQARRNTMFAGATPAPETLTVAAMDGEESDVMARYKREWPEPKP